MISLTRLVCLSGVVPPLRSLRIVAHCLIIAIKAPVQAKHPYRYRRLIDISQQHTKLSLVRFTSLHDRGDETTPSLTAPALVFALDGVLSSPLPSCGLVSGSVSLVDMGNLGHKRIVRVGVCQHRADGQKHFRDGQRRTPLITQNIQADATIRVDVWVVDAGSEVDLGRLERVVGREVNGQEEDTAGVWRIARSHNCSLPVEQILADRAGRARRGWISAEISELLVNALKSHFVMCRGGI